MFRSEVFPAPLGPMIDRISPLGTSIDTPSTAVTPPKRFDTLSTDIWTVAAVMRSVSSMTFMCGPGGQSRHQAGSRRPWRLDMLPARARTDKEVIGHCDVTLPDILAIFSNIIVRGPSC